MREDTQYFHRLFFLPVFKGLLMAVLIALAMTTAHAAPDNGAEEKHAADEEADIDFSQLARDFRKHCVRVFIHGRSADGVTPATGDFSDDIKHERPTSIGGYWWDENHAIIPDQGVQDRFIRSVEIGLPGNEKLYPGRIAGRFVRLQAVLIEVLPDADGELPPSTPLEFVDGDLEEAISIAYSWDEGEWSIKVDSGLGVSSQSDSGIEMVETGAQGVLVDADGLALGLSFGERLLVEDPDMAMPYWYGPEISYTPLLTAEDIRKSDADLRSRLSEAILECRFRIRVTMDEEEEDEMGYNWSPDSEDSQLRDTSAEVRAAGLVVDRRRLLVPVALPPIAIRRLEDIDVVLPGGRSIPAIFVGAFREYMAVVVEVGEDLPVQSLPSGFARLNPLAAPDAGIVERPWPLHEYIRRWRVDYSLGRRREMADYDRWLGTFRGFRGDTVVLTKTNEEDGHLAFDTEGNLVAMALTPRIINSRDRVQGTILKASPGFRPLDFLRKKLLADEAFDPALVPVDDENGQRLIDLGVEFQSLDANTAQLFNASRETRGGKIGVMLSHVYPGSQAEKLGLREKDVLVRLFVEGRTEPMELRSSGFSYGFDMDMSSDSFRRILQFLPPPWPARDNVVSTLLTGAGTGRQAAIEYVRDGETHRAEFVTGYFEPDYRCVRKERFRSLGLTAKPITFEVERYFGRKDRSGVIVSKVEVGGKSSVAGLHSYLLLTHVNGEKIADLDDFADKVGGFEEGAVPSVELTVEDFGKTRLVKIE